jgi:hypothetical protein
LDAVLPEKPAADHEMLVEIEGNGFPYARLKAVCNAPDDASCRWMPKCACEGWDLQKDEHGWFHTYEEYVTGDDTVTVKHRHTKESDCNVCEWLNADDPIECVARSVKTLEVASIPIKANWVGDFYEWEPAE